ncbi:hypothetical protein [Frankia sp. CcI49]|uniref:hypothetical protein n=1 Tax=Frankia sp. CcI49 TaxID=1745382 RepID=UPI0013041C0C|nr:hypothetical protein [Frankia sp. CcI49]
MTHTVRTTIRPDEEIEVDDTEYSLLRHEGLLVEDGREEQAPKTARRGSDSGRAE